jgi:hypothetical protein
LTGVGAHVCAEIDEAELTEDVREQCEGVSDTIDSGEDKDESEETRDGLRVGQSLISDGAHLVVGQRQSTFERIASLWALAIAEQKDNRRAPEPA